MELLKDSCHWCEEELTRPSNFLPWVGEQDNFVCLFHPANFDAIKMEATGETCYHQTMEEVYSIIVQHYHTQKALRNKEPLRAVGANVVSISKRASRTSREAAEKIEPKAGTIRYQIYSAIKDNNGLTDYELETLLRGKHQTISASRRSLVLDGWLIDSGRTRKNPQGNECIVWIVAFGAAQGVLL